MTWYRNQRIDVHNRKLKLTSTERKRLLQKRQKAEEKIGHVCRMLYDLGADKVFIFGSFVKGTFGLHSDIDIAVEGLPDEYIYRVEHKIEDTLGNIEFDLVYMETASEKLRRRIKEEGILCTKSLSLRNSQNTVESVPSGQPMEEGAVVDALNEYEEALREIEAVQRKMSRLKKVRDPEDADSHIKAIAGLTHGFYTGCEKVLKILIEAYDGSLPSGEDWHRQLLLRAKKPLKTIRPAIISEETFLILDDLREFRSAFRSMYYTDLVPERVLERAGSALKVGKLLKRDLLNFTDRVSARVKQGTERQEKLAQ